MQKNSFHHLFWDQKLKAVEVQDNRQVRWHPMVVHWCLSLNYHHLPPTEHLDHRISSCCQVNRCSCLIRN